jgi:hypothetical protein
MHGLMEFEVTEVVGPMGRQKSGPDCEDGRMVLALPR